jgi:hypothetical protein
MQIRELYHGTNGDNILQIIRSGAIRPNADGKVYFSERSFDSVLMHGPDTKRKATFALKLLVTLPATAILDHTSTAGVADTLIVTTPGSLQVQVLELYIREPRGTSVRTVKGVPEVIKYLSA